MKMLPLALVLPGFLFATAWAEEPVNFPDLNLKEAVEAELFISDPTPTQMLDLTELVIPLTWQRINAISDLTGLEYATNLTDLNLKYHKVSDLSPLSGLIHLRSVVLLGNGFSDISPLSTLVELESLDLESNEVTDITPLFGLPNLASLCLHRNPIPDISPLTSLTSLQWLDVRALPLDEDAYNMHIPQIKANNPGVTVLHDWVFSGQLLISSSVGGSVVDPGEGAFTFAFNQTLLVEAEANPGYVFIGWSGDLTSTDNPLPLTMDQNYTLHANFASALDTIHVDDNAPADPGANNPGVSDPQENGTREHPFDSIREAMDVAAKGATIFMHAGTYRETIDFAGRRLELTGFDPNDPNNAAWPVIDGNGNGPVASFTHSEDKNCRLAGLVITGGKSRTGAAIRCTTSSPTISNCLIVANRATDWDGAAVLCTDSQATFINCTIADNRGGQFGAGASLMQGQVIIVNSILWNNWPKEIRSEGDELPLIRYSAVAGGWLGTGALAVDPLFVVAGRWADRSNLAVTVSANDPGAVWLMGDYHLQSQAGRWDQMTGVWLSDGQTSPCIDAGGPATPVGQEPSPNGAIINMGVYGGTTEASKSRSDAP